MFVLSIGVGTVIIYISEFFKSFSSEVTFNPFSNDDLNAALSFEDSISFVLSTKLFISFIRFVLMSNPITLYFSAKRTAKGNPT